jgi:hypothetical protein
MTGTTLKKGPGTPTGIKANAVDLGRSMDSLVELSDALSKGGDIGMRDIGPI